jgi:adenine-specific DNA-methyltransferase
LDITPYHAKYFAYELTKRCPSDSIEKLAGAVASAQGDLNPHQDKGQTLGEEGVRRLFSLPGKAGQSLLATTSNEIDAIAHRRQTEIQRNISERNAQSFEAETDKLDGWSDDLMLGLERQIKEMDRQIKEARRSATAALTLEEKLAGQKQIKALEAQRNEKRRSLFDAQDKVDKQREELIANIEGKLAQEVTLTQLFTVRWRLE